MKPAFRGKTAPPAKGMRVIAGAWRGRKLAAPEGETTRPTADRVRETLFSMLTSRLGSFEGLAVADLFAGSGALGLEALSRGAASCLFVDQDAAAIRAIRRNVAELGAESRSEVRAGSVLALGQRRGNPLDLLLLDPPYGTGAGQVAVDKLARQGWIGPATWISLETGHDEDADIRGFGLVASRDVGKARLHFLKMAAEA